MSITSVGSNYGMSGMGQMGGPGGMRRPDPTKMAEDLFSKLDSSGQGYIDKASLQSALDSVSGSSSTTTSASSGSDSVDELFSTLDSDGDGKVTKDEFTSGMQQLSEQLDSQFHQMRMQGMGGAQSQGMAGGMPPPPPAGGQQDQGLSKEQMTDMLSQVSGTDSKLASQLSEVLKDFSAADSDGDGKVTFQETMAYNEIQKTSGSTSSSAVSQTSDSAGSGSSSNSSDVNSKLLQQMVKLMHAYGGMSGHAELFEQSSSFSVAA